MAKVESLEAWRDKMDGATGALAMLGKALWAVFGAAILSIAYFIIRNYFGQGR